MRNIEAAGISSHFGHIQPRDLYTGAIRYSAQKYLHAFRGWRLPFEYTGKIAQKAGSYYHLVARVQRSHIAYNAVFIHTGINLADHFIANWGWNSAETDHISYAACKVDIVQHL